MDPELQDIRNLSSEVLPQLLQRIVVLFPMHSGMYTARISHPRNNTLMNKDALLDVTDDRSIKKIARLHTSFITTPVQVAAAINETPKGVVLDCRVVITKLSNPMMRNSPRRKRQPRKLNGCELE
jgi:hypothetical protein